MPGILAGSKKGEEHLEDYYIHIQKNEVEVEAELKSLWREWGDTYRFKKTIRQCVAYARLCVLFTDTFHLLRDLLDFNGGEKVKDTEVYRRIAKLHCYLKNDWDFALQRADDQKGKNVTIIHCPCGFLCGYPMYGGRLFFCEQHPFFRVASEE